MTVFQLIYSIAGLYWCNATWDEGIINDSLHLRQNVSYVKVLQGSMKVISSCQKVYIVIFIQQKYKSA